MSFVGGGATTTGAVDDAGRRLAQPDATAAIVSTHVASQMQDRLRSPERMQFPAGLDTGLATLDEPRAHVWTVEVWDHGMPHRSPGAAR
jgi:hypothetical protein